MEPIQQITDALSSNPEPIDSERFVFQTKTAAAVQAAPPLDHTLPAFHSGRTAPPPLRSVKMPTPPLFHFTLPADSADPPKVQEALPDYGVAYFRQMLTQYWTFPTNDEDPSACIHFNLQAIAVIYGLILKYKSSKLTWEDLYELETAMLRVLPEAMLRSQARILRARYREVMPQTQFRHYRQSQAAVGDDQTLPKETLRAEMETLLSEMQKYRTVVPSITQGKSVHTSLTAPWITAGALAALGVCGTLHFVLLPAGISLALALLAVSASGAAGGLMSLQKRFEDAIARKMAIVDEVEAKPMQLSRRYAALSGAFFAVLLFFAFRSHALQGIVFPDASRTGLTNPVAFALLLAWSSGAGYAERFVPAGLGTLQTLLRQAALRRKKL